MKEPSQKAFNEIFGKKFEEEWQQSVKRIEEIGEDAYIEEEDKKHFNTNEEVLKKKEDAYYGRV